jgi:prophage DNA circulation protein
MALTFDQSMLELDEGLLADVIILFESIEDTLEKSIAQYLYPYADGADLEDMGQKPHTIRFKCWFWDDAEQQSYDTHTLLLDALKEKSLLDFVHPKYGLMQGKIMSIVVQHDDQERCASLEINFIEQGRVNLEVAAPTPVQAAVEDAYITGQVEQEELLSSDIAEAIPEDSGILSKILDEASGLLEQAQEYSNQMRAFVGAVEGYIATAESVVNQVMSPVNSLQATITYAANLPGRILGPIAGAVEKVALLYTSLKNIPSQFIDNLDDAFDDLLDAFDEFADDHNDTTGAATIMRDCLEIACAQRLALEAAAIYDTDNTVAADPLSDPDFQVMNINELEATLAVVRARIEAAVGKAREMDSLKTMAVSLLHHVNNVRLEREKMQAVVLDNAMPLHLVCLKYGLPYQDAERLIRVNNIPNPNFTAGEVMVYVR